MNRSLFFQKTLNLENLRLFGRRGELEFLDCLLEQSDASPTLLFIKGQAGVGKSKLIQAFMEQHKRKYIRIVAGKFDPEKSAQPFLGLVDALEELFTAETENTQTRNISMQYQRQPREFLQRVQAHLEEHPASVDLLQEILPQLLPKTAQLLEPFLETDIFETHETEDISTPLYEQSPLSSQPSRRTVWNRSSPHNATTAQRQQSMASIPSSRTSKSPSMRKLKTFFSTRKLQSTRTLHSTRQMLPSTPSRRFFGRTTSQRTPSFVPPQRRRVSLRSQSIRQLRRSSLMQHVTTQKERGFQRLVAALRLLLRCYVGSNETATGNPNTSSQRLVIILEDLQWADQMTVDVLQALCFSHDQDDAGSLRGQAAGGHQHLPIQRLFMIGTFRDNHATNSFTATTGIQQQCLAPGFYQLILSNLTLHEIHDLFRQVVKYDLENEQETLQMAHVLLEKTDGNPFYLLEFLKYLQSHQLIYYCVQTFSWKWKPISEIQRSAPLADNVVELVLARIQQLPMETQRLLKIASCLGARFRSNLLQAYDDKYNIPLFQPKHNNTNTVNDNSSNNNNHNTLHRRPLPEPSSALEATLQVAVDQGILLRVHEPENVIQTASRRNLLQTTEPSTMYQWAHDKLQEAAYSMIATEQTSLHMRLGRLLWELCLTEETEQDPEMERMVFLAADQLNRVSSMIEQPSILVGLAGLNLKAAELSIDMSAYYPAADFLRKGVALLDPQTRWQESYFLTLQLFSLLAEMERLLGNHKQSMDAVDQVMKNARSLEDRYRVHFVLVESIGSQRRLGLAIQKCLQHLSMHSVSLPVRPSRRQIAREQRKIKNLPLPRGGGTQSAVLANELLEFPLMVDETSLYLSKILGQLLVFAVLAGKTQLAAVVCIRALEFTLQSGVCEQTPLFLACYGIYWAWEGKTELAYEYGRIAMQLMNSIDARGWSARTIVAVHTCLRHFKRPFHESLEPFLEAYRTGFETGDIEFALISARAYCTCYLASGLPLQPLEKDLLAFREQVARYGLPSSIEMSFRVFRQTILNLQGRSDNPLVLSGESINEKEVLAQGDFLSAQDIYLNRLVLAYTFGDMALAEEMMNKQEDHPLLDVIAMRSITRDMYEGLAAFVLARSKGNRKMAARGRKVIKKFEARMKKGSPNCHHIVLFLRAEELVTEGGDEASVKSLYDEAAASCGRRGYTHYGAMVNERAGLFFLDRNDEFQAHYYLRQAVDLFEEWGALAKVDQMRKDHAFLKSSSMKASTSLKGRTRFSRQVTARLRQIKF